MTTADAITRIDQLERAVAAVLMGLSGSSKQRERRLKLLASGEPIRLVVEVDRGRVRVTFEERTI